MLAFNDRCHSANNHQHIVSSNTRSTFAIERNEWTILESSLISPTYCSWRSPLSATALRNTVMSHLVLNVSPACTVAPYSQWSPLNTNLCILLRPWWTHQERHTRDHRKCLLLIPVPKLFSHSFLLAFCPDLHLENGYNDEQECSKTSWDY